MPALHGLLAPTTRPPTIHLLRFLRAQIRNELRGECVGTSTRIRHPGNRIGDGLRAIHRERRTIRAPALCSQHIQRSNHERISVLQQQRAGLHASTAWTQNTLWRQLRGQKPSRPRYDELPPLSGFLDDTSGLGGRIIKPSHELKLRCTEFDENGNVTLVNGEFRKSELIAKYSLLPRDLRKIDSSVLPHILVRPSAILINLLHLRCLIKHNRVLVFDVYGSTDSYAQSLFMYDLEGKLRQKPPASNVANPAHLAYEFRALEAVLISVTGGLESEFEGVRDPVLRVLRELEEDIDRDKLRYLLVYSKKLGTFEQRARLVRDAIEDILEAEDDLAAMYLTEKAEGISREEDNHEEIELLLESYHKIADEIVQQASNLVSAIRNTEEIVRAILDANRNSLMLLDLKFSIGTLGISAGMFVAALYGMNLENFIEETSWGFGAVSMWCTVLSIAACMYGFRKLRVVQRLSMWGEGLPNKPRSQPAPFFPHGPAPKDRAPPSSSFLGSSGGGGGGGAPPPRRSQSGWNTTHNHHHEDAEVNDKSFAEAVTGVTRADRQRRSGASSASSPSPPSPPSSSGHPPAGRDHQKQTAHNPPSPPTRHPRS